MPEVVKLSGVTFKSHNLVIEGDNRITPTDTGTHEGDATENGLSSNDTPSG